MALQFDQQELVEGLLLHASLAQFGESARLKPGRSLVRFQDLARTCRNEFSDAPYQGFAPKGDCSGLGPTDRRVCGGCHPRKGHLSPSAGSQSRYQALGVRAFSDSSIGSSFRLLTGWFQVRVLVGEREEDGTTVRSLGPVHRTLVGELGDEDGREVFLGIQKVMSRLGGSDVAQWLRAPLARGRLGFESRHHT